VLLQASAEWLCSPRRRPRAVPPNVRLIGPLMPEPGRSLPPELDVRNFLVFTTKHLSVQGKASGLYKLQGPVCKPLLLYPAQFCLVVLLRSMSWQLSEPVSITCLVTSQDFVTGSGTAGTVYASMGTFYSLGERAPHPPTLDTDDAST
jgi:hypothetical protein